MISARDVGPERLRVTLRRPIRRQHPRRRGPSDSAGGSYQMDLNSPQLREQHPPEVPRRASVDPQTLEVSKASFSSN